MDAKICWVVEFDHTFLFRVYNVRANYRKEDSMFLCGTKNTFFVVNLPPLPMQTTNNQYTQFCSAELVSSAGLLMALVMLQGSYFVGKLNCCCDKYC